MAFATALARRSHLKAYGKHLRPGFAFHPGLLKQVARASLRAHNMPIILPVTAAWAKKYCRQQDSLVYCHDAPVAARSPSSASSMPLDIIPGLTPSLEASWEELRRQRKQEWAEFGAPPPAEQWWVEEAQQPADAEISEPPASVRNIRKSETHSDTGGCPDS